MPIHDLLQKCCETPGVTLHTTPTYAELTMHSPNGTGRMRFLPVFPGVTLAYISIQAPAWPAPDLAADPAAKPPLLINYCVRGRCEVVLNNTDYVYVSDRQLSLTECFARNSYIYPRGLYEGLEFFIDLPAATAPDGCLMQQFGLDLHALPRRWCPDQTTYISAGTADLQAMFQALWALGTQEDERAAFRRHLAVLALLEELCRLPQIPAPQVSTYYTGSQVAIAKQTEALLTADIARHIPAHELAAQFSISETSLKNYFRGVYGQNISTYLRELRMKKAAEFLASTRDSVAEIAARVGYENQSKFAGVFRTQYGMSPLEYRRTQRLTAQTAP